MNDRILKPTFLLAASIAFSAVSANAASFDFYKLIGDPPGATDFIPDGTKGVDYFENNDDYVSSDLSVGFGGDLEFTSGGITATATGTHNGGVASVVQDHEGGWTSNPLNSAGLGVYHLVNDLSDDNITTGELLKITFNQSVTITKIELRAEGHNVTNWVPGATFLLNGVSTALPTGTGVINNPAGLTGTMFTFAYGGDTPDQFYLASLTVPDSGTTLALLGLGLIGMAAVGRRMRK